LTSGSEIVTREEIIDVCARNGRDWSCLISRYQRQPDLCGLHGKGVVAREMLGNQTLHEAGTRPAAQHNNFIARVSF